LNTLLWTNSHKFETHVCFRVKVAMMNSIQKSKRKMKREKIVQMQWIFITLKFFVIFTGPRTIHFKIRYAHTITHTHTHYHTVTHYHAITLSHYHTHTLSHYHTITHTHYHTITLSHTHTHTLSHTFSLSKFNRSRVLTRIKNWCWCVW
jgi:hypothetical protein